MTNKISRVQSMLEPIWQEISSLWSGAEFAFYDQSLDTDEAESQRAGFPGMARMESPVTAEMGPIGQYC
jgi:hypothetical protein